MSEEKPPYKNPYLCTIEEYPYNIKQWYPHKYTNEIQHIRNWLDKNWSLVKAANPVPEESQPDISAWSAWPEELFAIMQKAGYFTGDRAWMAEHSYVTQKLIEYACEWIGASPN